MIRLRTAPNTSSGAVLKAIDVEIDYCGTACVFHSLTETCVFGQNGARLDSIAACDGRTIWMNVAEGDHGPDHLLYLPVTMATPRAVRSKLLRRVCEAKPVGVAPVFGCCHCGMVMQFADGGVLRGTGRTPGWAITLAPALDRSDAASSGLPQDTLAHLANLARGLNELHQLGVAHRDPFPFNAAFLDKSCVWIDLNSCAPLDPRSERLDVIAFFHLAFTSTVLSFPGAAGWIQRTLSVFETDEPRLVLERLEVSFRAMAGETDLADTAVCRSEIWRDYSETLERWSRDLHWSARTCLDHSKLHLDFLWNESEARLARRHLLLERKRHLVAEQEFARTNHDRMKIKELTAWSAELQRAQAWWQTRAAELESNLAQSEAEVERLRSWAQSLEEAREWHSRQSAAAEEEGQRAKHMLAETRAWLAEVEKARDYQKSAVERVQADNDKARLALSKSEEELRSVSTKLDRATAERDDAVKRCAQATEAHRQTTLEMENKCRELEEKLQLTIATLTQMRASHWWKIGSTLRFTRR